jgi:hypothetical protein
MNRSMMMVATTLSLLVPAGCSKPVTPPVPPSPVVRVNPAPKDNPDSTASRLSPGDEAIVLRKDPNNQLPAVGWGMIYDSPGKDGGHWHNLEAGDRVRLIDDTSTVVRADSIGFGESTRRVVVKVLDGENQGMVGEINRDVLSLIHK